MSSSPLPRTLQRNPPLNLNSRTPRPKRRFSATVEPDFPKAPRWYQTTVREACATAMAEEMRRTTTCS